MVAAIPPLSANMLRLSRTGEQCSRTGLTTNQQTRGTTRGNSPKLRMLRKYTYLENNTANITEYTTDTYTPL